MTFYELIKIISVDKKRPLMYLFWNNNAFMDLRERGAPQQPSRLPNLKFGVIATSA
jgi:hypothetical protein